MTTLTSETRTLFDSYESQFHETFYTNICRYINSMISLDLPLGLEQNQRFKNRFVSMMKCATKDFSRNDIDISREYLYDFIFVFFSPTITDYLYDNSKQELRDLVIQFTEYLDQCHLYYRDTLEDEEPESDG